MATGNIPGIVVGTEAPDYAQSMATDVNDGINRINSALGTVNTDIADLQTSVAALEATVVTPGTSTKVTYNAHGQITAGTNAVAADISDFNTAVRTNSLDQMTAPAANVSFNSKKITSLADATSATDALNRQTADSRYVGTGTVTSPIFLGQNNYTDPASFNNYGGCLYAASADAALSISRASSAGLSLSVDADAAVAIFYRSGGLAGSISVSSGATAFNTSSDYRLKEDLEPMIGSLDRLKALRPLSFHWKVDEKRDHKTEGFLAHEVQTIVPGAVCGEKDGETTQMIDYSRLVPLLVGAVQELSARVEQLEGTRRD